VDQYLNEILSSGPEGIAAAKALIPEVWKRTAADATDITARAIAKQRVSAEGQEGMGAFLEKRNPSFKANK
jgi:methylglutaconyl-CoA hydratase